MRSAAGLPRDITPSRSHSHPQLMHLLSSSGFDSPGMRSPVIRAHSSDDEESSLDRSREHHSKGSDERGLSRAQTPKPSTGMFGGLSNFWYSGGSPASVASPSHDRSARQHHGRPEGQHQNGSKKKQKTSRPASEDESGFDSDSEPDPIQTGPGGHKARGEKKPLLKGGERGRSRRTPKDTDPMQAAYGATQEDSRSNDGLGLKMTHPAVEAARASDHVYVRETSPQGTAPTALENRMPSRESQEGSLDRALIRNKRSAQTVDKTKKALTVGEYSAVDGDIEAQDNGEGKTDHAEEEATSKTSGNAAHEDEERDTVADLPGGKRERDRLALRRAVPGWEEQEEGQEKAVQFAINSECSLRCGKVLALGSGPDQGSGS